MLMMTWWLSNCITARREIVYFSVSNAGFLSQEDCVESSLHCACFCEWNIQKVILYFDASLQFYPLFWIIVFALFVWKISVLCVGNWCRKWQRVGERIRGMTEHPEAMLIRTSSFFPLPSFLALSVSLHSSLTSLDDSRSSQIIASLSGVFSLLPAPPLPLALSSSFLSCFLPPSSFLRSSLPRSLFEPSGHRSAQCQERKGREARGWWVGGWEKGWWGRWNRGLLWRWTEESH